ncbi:hypothetical protein [Bacillus sp. 2205SS5-2]|uniref:hypothetical protein n=1 Tax=Bacillus sp. 2205SS5-2 TaxID=3109031 RepID=UPI003006173C
MRKVTGIQPLIHYLHSVQYPLSEEKIQELIVRKQIPHLKRMNHVLIFNLDFIDSWIREQKKSK